MTCDLSSCNLLLEMESILIKVVFTRLNAKGKAFGVTCHCFLLGSSENRDSVMEEEPNVIYNCALDS